MFASESANGDAMVRIPLTDDPIEYLVKRKFRDYNHVRRFQPLSTLGHGGIPSDYRQQRLKQIDAYEAELRAKPKEELSALYEQEQEKEREELRLDAALEEQARFFNQPYAKADFDHWSKATYWTLDEALALSFGKAPEHVKWETVKGFENSSPFAKKYARARDLALRAIAWNQLYDPVLPTIFLAWAKRNDIAVPPELLEAVEKRGTMIADWKDLYDKLKVQYDEMIGKANQEISKGNEAIAKLGEDRESLKRDNAQLQAQLAELNAKVWEGFDPDSDTYPRELDIAMQAWRAVTNNRDAKMTAKEQIDQWLSARYPDIRSLSAEARQRIAVVCNWEKSGGRRRRDEK